MPEVVTSLARWRGLTEGLRGHGASVGVVLTMGALHDGHAALLSRARAECDAALLSIFVNPRQFNDASDLAAYHVDLAADLGVAGREGVTAVLAPSVEEVWPDWPAPTATSVHVAGLSEILEGQDRPGHFDGVAAVVAKLLVATGPCTTYFGEKDFQQLCVVRRMVSDLSVPATVVGCETVRDADGLALSSRNARLSTKGRAAALALPRALAAGRTCLARGGGAHEAEASMREVLGAEPEVTPAYAAAVEPATLRTPPTCAPGTELRLLVAAHVEGVRLIDNAPGVVGHAT